VRYLWQVRVTGNHCACQPDIIRHIHTR
jgi:hypothetical protein